MITLTIANPNNDALMTAGFTLIRVNKSTSGTAAGPFSALTPDITLLTGVTSYLYLDPLGNPGDWYTTQFVSGGNTLSSATAPEPAYLSDLCNAIRDALGVSPNEISDATIQGMAYLPAAFGRIRLRLPTFDALVTAGGDPAALCLSALTHLTAYLLCQRLKTQVMDREQFKDYQYQRNKQMDWDATAAALLATYEMAISQAAGDNANTVSMYVSPMGLAGPSRAGLDNSGLISIYPDPLENPLFPYSNIPPNQ